MQLAFIKLTNTDSGEPMFLPARAQAIYRYKEQDRAQPPLPGMEALCKGEEYTVYMANGERFAVREDPQVILDKLNTVCHKMDEMPDTGVSIFDLTGDGDRPES